MSKGTNENPKPKGPPPIPKPRHRPRLDIPRENIPGSDESEHACLWTKDYISATRQLREQIDKVTELERHLRASDAKKNQMKNNCSDQVNGICIADNMNICVLQCARKECSRNRETGLLELD